MIFAKIDVSMPRHYRLLEVRPECVGVPLGVQGDADGVVRPDADAAVPADVRSTSDRTRAEVCKRIARAAALGVWTAALCYTRDHMLDGFCPLAAIADLAADEVVDELVERGLFARAEREGYPGVVIVNYAKHNETRADVERRLHRDRARKEAERRPSGRRVDTARHVRVDSARTPPTASHRIPRSESESEPEPEPESDGKELPSQASAPPEPRSERSQEHRELVAHYAAEFERLKGVKPVIGAKGGAGAKKLLEGRTLAEAKAIVDRALSDPWVLENSPDLSAIAGRINAFIGRRVPTGGGPHVQLQPATGSWKVAQPGQIAGPRK
jgi:hypothetical protein